MECEPSGEVVVRSKRAGPWRALCSCERNITEMVYRTGFVTSNLVTIEAHVLGDLN